MDKIQKYEVSKRLGTGYPPDCLLTSFLKKDNQNES